MKMLWLVIVVSVTVAVDLAAQSTVQEVQKAVEEGNMAARKGDKVGYGRYLADDLSWVTTEGQLETKQQRLAVLGANVSPTISDIKVQDHGNVAAVTAILTSTNGAKSRVARTLVKRDGRWQLVLHAATAMK
jgi:ketosteroid isomerase-like protein